MQDRHPSLLTSHATPTNEHSNELRLDTLQMHPTQSMPAATTTTNVDLFCTSAYAYGGGYLSTPFFFLNFLVEDSPCPSSSARTPPAVDFRFFFLEFFGVSAETSAACAAAAPLELAAEAFFAFFPWSGVAGVAPSSSSWRPFGCSCPASGRLGEYSGWEAMYSGVIVLLSVCAFVSRCV